MEKCEQIMFGNYSRTNENGEPTSRFQAVNKWRNNLKGGEYEKACLLASFVKRGEKNG